MTFIVALENGTTIRHTAQDGCKDRDVIVYRMKRLGWRAVSASPLRGD